MLFATAISFGLALFSAQLFGYLLGAIPFGYLVSRWVAGIDIRAHGSKNIGATNVWRVLGKQWGLTVFALDFLKGALPVASATWLQSTQSIPGLIPDEQRFFPEFVGLATILGHMFPVYLGFVGGKGVATSIGVMFVLAPLPGAIAFGVWGLATSGTRMVSAGSLLSAVVFAVAYFVQVTDPFHAHQLPMTLLAVTAALLVIFRHTKNIGRILRGTEPRWGNQPPGPPPDAAS